MDEGTKRHVLTTVSAWLDKVGGRDRCDFALTQGMQTCSCISRSHPCSCPNETATLSLVIERGGGTHDTEGGPLPTCVEPDYWSRP